MSAFPLMLSAEEGAEAVVESHWQAALTTNVPAAHVIETFIGSHPTPDSHPESAEKASCHFLTT